MAAADMFEESQQKILKLSKEKPSLRNLLATRLEQLAEKFSELEVAELSAQEGSFEFSSVERIKQGFVKFKTEKFLKQPGLFNQLKKGQSPKFMVFACSDSRVCPTTILGFEPGEAFVVRNVANKIPPWDKSGYPGSSAALLHLKVSNILVIGHSRCGGIHALISHGVNGKPWSDFIESWIRIGEPACARTLATIADADIGKQCTHCEKESVNLSLTNLLTFPWVRDEVRDGKVSLHGAHYDFLEGSLELWTVDLKVSSITTL
ncbi:hypothetical protein O6H91_08G002400 [Diphasiastrum complanatum]|uniref:Uncharacterized protein n=1 Tax=Diphasiastrum complanatum TaxID=34168 RepID=A0ACC2CU78_DIPCM|nr:hypothetical protein O6H91_08G002400 [Diphasiastrum complanatum]